MCVCVYVCVCVCIKCSNCIVVSVSFIIVFFFKKMHTPYILYCQDSVHIYLQHAELKLKFAAFQRTANSGYLEVEGTL